MIRKKLFFLVLGLVFLLIFTGCSSFPSVRNDFEDAGYEYSDDVKAYLDNLLEEFEEDDVVVKTHAFTKGLNIAIILEFTSTEELEEQLSESETLKGMVKDFQKTDYVRGNCVLIPIGIKSEEIIKVFQGE